MTQAKHGSRCRLYVHLDLHCSASCHTVWVNRMYQLVKRNMNKLEHLYSNCVTVPATIACQKGRRDYCQMKLRLKADGSFGAWLRLYVLGAWLRPWRLSWLLLVTR